ncbi:MAG: hypothetical protein PVG65_07235 [Candidatus Thorarchaeota archaeon]|jgi:small subunit ribosomal protein S13e
MAKEKTEKKTEKKLKAADIEKLVVELAKKGLTPEKIGLELKKKGINAKSQKIKIGTILKKHGLFQDADIINLQKKIESLKKHLEKNKHDYRTKRSFMTKSAKLNILKKYRKKKLK